MIGNDLVDVQIAFSEKKSENLRFIEKVFTLQEQKLISQSEDKETTLWLLWSMKEAAYKAHQRVTRHETKFNPKDYKCRLLNFSNLAEVKVSSSFYFINYSCTDRYIHSIATESSAVTVFEKIYYKKQEAKLSFIKDYSNKNGLAPGNVSIEKDALGIPSIVNEKTRNKVPVSLSHHGNFSAYIFPLIKS